MARASVSLSAMQDASGNDSEPITKQESVRPDAANFRLSSVRVLALSLVVVMFLVAPIVLHEAVHVFVAVITGVSPYDLDVGFVGLIRA